MFNVLILCRIEGIIMDTDIGHNCDRENFTSKEAVYLLKKENDHNRPRMLFKGTASKKRNNKINF